MSGDINTDASVEESISMKAMILNFSHHISAQLNTNGTLWIDMTELSNSLISVRKVVVAQHVAGFLL